MEIHAPLINLDWTLVMVVITMVVFYLIMKHFFFEKVHNFMLARQELVVESFEQAEETNKLADEKLREYEKMITEIEGEAREIIKNAKMKAEAQAQSIIANAHKQASEINMAAERQIENERAKALLEMKEQISGLALYAAEKILEKQLQEAGQNEIIDQIIEQAGKTAWRS